MADAEVAALRATAHPLRLQILSLLTGASMSAAELARELGTTQANASYHLRVLAEAGEVVLDGKERVRGGVAKRYRHPWNRKRATRRPKVDATPQVRAMATELTRRFDQRRDGSKQLFTDAEMWVTPETWARVLELVREASALIHGEAQPPRSEGTIHVNLTLAAFQMRDQS